MALVAVLAPVALVGCSDGTGPSQRVVSPDTVVLGLSSVSQRSIPSQVRLLDGVSGATLGRATEPAPIFAVDPANREMVGLVQRGRVGRPDDELLGFSFPDLAVQWRVGIEDLDAELPEGFRVGRPALLDRGGRWIILGTGALGTDRRGIAILERDTRSSVALLTGFANGFNPRNTLTFVEPAATSELIVLGGTREPDEAIRLLILDSRTLTLRDSVELRTGLEPRLSSVASARDGRHVFALTLDSLFKVDVTTAEIVDRRLRSRQRVRSVIAVTRDRSRLFLTDRGPFLSPGLPGSGALQVYDAETLSSLGRVSLATDKLERGRPLFQTDMIAVGEGRVYVRSGNSPATIFGPTQPSTISVVNVSEMRVEDTWVFDPTFQPLGGLAVF